eukprot:Clim_evm8s44 gene=Clim_evmTU8s44
MSADIVNQSPSMEPCVEHEAVSPVSFASSPQASSPSHDGANSPEVREATMRSTNKVTAGAHEPFQQLRQNLLEWRFPGGYEEALKVLHERIDPILHQSEYKRTTLQVAHRRNVRRKPVLVMYESDDESSGDGGHAVVRIAVDGLLTVDICWYAANVNEEEDFRLQNTDPNEATTDVSTGARLSGKIYASMQDFMVEREEQQGQKEEPDGKNGEQHGHYEYTLARRLPMLRRGSRIARYVPTVNNLLVEYDFDQTVFEQQSPFQHVRIMHSNQYGNMLLLDGDPNLAEADKAYSHAITGNGRIDFDGKTVLILGGGDGGILKILREDYKCDQIIMIDIDEVVVNAARKHLRGICGDAMDNLKGENYEVIIGDCFEYLTRYQEEGVKFDVIINDLTACPINPNGKGELWQFVTRALEQSIACLHPNHGVYFTQGNSVNAVKALQVFEGELDRLRSVTAPASDLTFSRETVCVPSYQEMWVFYEIRLTAQRC